MSLNQAAKQAGCSYDKIRRAVEKGFLPAYRCKGKIVVRRQDVEIWSTPAPAVPQATVEG